MHWIDWTIIGVYLVWIIWDGLRMTKHSGELEGYFLASRSLPWWAVGLSVMATQLSAITMIGTTGQGYAERHGAAAVLLRAADRDDHPVGDAGAVLPQRARLHRLRVPREALRLEDAHASPRLLFLLSRGMATGAVISAPAVVLSVMMGISVTTTCLLIGAADGRLHDVRRRAGGDLDRREADVPHRLRPAGSGDRADAGPAGRTSASPMP